MRDDFAVLIISHERANDIITIDALKASGYTGKTYIIIDDMDRQKDDYIKNFGEDNVIIFSKAELDGTFDMMDNFDSYGTEVYARNVSFKVARDLGLKYFVELDEDYYNFNYRFESRDENGVETLRAIYSKHLDDVFEVYIELLETVPKIKCISFAQAGDFIGGVDSRFKQHILRKSMNSFFFRVPENPKDDVQFLGRMNDDVNTYVHGGIVGEYWCQMCRVMLRQEISQQKTTGLATLYKDFGTYVKSMYTIMLSPSSVKISTLGPSNPRIHHLINWETTVPKLISERYKK